MSKFRLLFSNINLALSKTNPLENLGCKDSGNLSSQYSIASRPYSWEIFECSPTTSNVVKMVFHLFSLDHFARKSRLLLMSLLIWIKNGFNNISTRLLKRRVG